MPYFKLSKDEITFPPAYFADNEGLVAVGGDMCAKRLLLAYHNGFFYWHFPLKHLKWWSPDPRTVIQLDSFEFPESSYKSLQQNFQLSFDTNFEQLLRECQAQYNIKNQMGHAWLAERAFRTFMQLHQEGWAHSIEVWNGNDLIGGLFGVGYGTLFWGEYAFEKEKGAKKFALLSLLKSLKEKGFQLIDAQKPTFFVEGIAYDELSRMAYLGLTKENASASADPMLMF